MSYFNSGFRLSYSHAAAINAVVPMLAQSPAVVLTVDARVPVPGGWLYRNIILEERRAEVWETTLALCFVPAEGRAPDGGRS